MHHHLDYVVSIAKSANASGFHFGSIIFNGGDLISCGWCQEKTHPTQAKYMKYSHSYKHNNSWLHAEIHAIISAKRSLNGFDIVTARWAENKLKPSYPCGACYQAMSVVGIRRMWYLNDMSQWLYKNVN